MSSVDNKRIAKNTLFLYVRMIVLMGITFFTSRLVLEALGVKDFGVYNVVGGIVSLLSFLNSSMTIASQRFISYEIGLKEKGNVKKIFCTSVNCHILISLFILIIAETIGLWMVTNLLKIPDEIKSDAFVVYQCCVFLSLISVVQVPYMAAIISYENMKLYSIISISETILKLCVVIIIIHSHSNKLIEYAILNLCVGIIVFIFYLLYVNVKFINCRYSIIWDKVSFKSILAFSGWSTLSGSSVILSQQGGNVLINYFCGVAVNAAYGLGAQVSGALNALVANFQLAFKPQIVKLYADNQTNQEFKLINIASKFSFYLMMLVFIPFVINGHTILTIWLNIVPKYTLEFCIWIVVFQMIDALQGPIWMAIYATGKIKSFTIVSCLFTLSNIPISFILLKHNFSPVIVVVIRALLNLGCSIFRLQILHNLTGYDVKSYIIMCLRNVIPCLIVAFGLSWGIKLIFSNNIMSFIIVTFISIMIVLCTIYTLGLNAIERNYLIDLIKTKINS